MGIFSHEINDNVSIEEMKDVRNQLYAKGFDKKDIRFLEVLFRADLSEDERHQKGVSEGEIDDAISFLKHHPNHHHFSSKELKDIEEVMKGKL